MKSNNNWTKRVIFAPLLGEQLVRFFEEGCTIRLEEQWFLWHCL